MISASCHCGAIRYEVETAPEWLLDCNCSICRKVGGLWAYYPQREIKFATPPRTDTYMWGDHILVFHRCAKCGCHTHYTEVGTDDAERIGVNARLMAGLSPYNVRVIQKNNGNDGVFWTVTHDPVLPSHDRPS